MSSLRRVAYAALGIPFVILGYQAVAEPGGRVAAVAALGLPDPETLVQVNGAAMVVGGAALAAGILPRLAAAGLVASLVPTTLAGHPFWKADDEKTRAMQRTQALKNIVMVGGLLAVAATRRPRRRPRRCVRAQERRRAQH